MRRTVIISRGPFAVLAAVVLLALFAVGDAGAAPSGSIAGSVTSDGGKPAAGICVRVDELVDGDRQSVGSATTELDGTYVVTDLAAGQYLVEFADCNDGMLVQQWWQGAPDPESATPITLADAEQRTGIDATMQVGGTIRGRVTDVGGAPLEDLCVIGVRGDADQISGIGFARTEPDGTYVMSGVSPGATRVLFEQCDDSARLVPQWFDGADSFGNATVLTVVAGGELTAIDGQLRPAAAVAGRVTNTAGDPVGDVCVQATSDRASVDPSEPTATAPMSSSSPMPGPTGSSSWTATRPRPSRPAGGVGPPIPARRCPWHSRRVTSVSGSTPC